jgi:hypothetical protein
MVMLLFVSCGSRDMFGSRADAVQIEHEEIEKPEQEGDSFVSNCVFRRCEAIAKSTQQRCERCTGDSSEVYCWQHRP